MTEVGSCCQAIFLDEEQRGDPQVKRFLMIRCAPGDVYRGCLLFGLLGIIMVLLGVGACDHSGSEEDAIAGVPLSQLSDPVREMVLWQRDAFRQVPVTRAAEDVRTFYRLRQDLRIPERRAAAEDSLYKRLSEDPEHFLWLEARFVRTRYLEDPDRYETLIRRAAEADSTGPVALFIHAWRYRRQEPDAELSFLEAGKRCHELGPLQRQWLELRQSLVESRRGRSLEGLARLQDNFMEAWDTGGLPLAACRWFEISKITRQLGWLDDALVAAQLAIDCATMDGNSILEIRGHLARGRVHQARAEYDEAVVEAMKSQQLAADGQHHRWAQDASRLLAGILDSRGDSQETLALSRELREMSMAVADTPAVICADLSLALSHMSLGAVDSAHVWLEKASQLDDSGTGHGFGNRVALIRWSFYLQEGDWEQAESSLASVQGSLVSRARRQILFTMIRHGFDTGRPDLIYRSIEQARQDSTLMITDPNFNTAQELALLAARFHARQGEFHLAYQELAIVAEFVRAGTPKQGLWDFEDCQGRVAELAGDLEGSIDHHRMALALAVELQAPSLQNRSRIGLGELLIRTEQVDEARALFSSARENPEYWTRLTSSLLLGCTEAAAGQHDEALHHFQATDEFLREGAPIDLRARLQLEKARSLVQLNRLEEALTELEGVSLAPGTGFSAMSSEVFRSFHRPLHRDIAELMIKLKISLSKGIETEGLALETLAIAEAARWRVDPAGSEPDVESLGKLAMASGSPILAYFMGREHVFRWIGAPSGWSVTEVSNREVLLTLVRDVQTDMESPEHPVGWDDARRLARILLDPVIPFWDKGSPLHLVVSGSLSGLAWPALPLADRDPEKNLVIDRGPIIHLSSLTSLPRESRDRGVHSPEHSLLSIGVNDPGHDPELQYAEDEAQAVADLWQEYPVTLVTGEDATWTRIRALDLGQYSVIHLASHAVVTQGLPGCSTLRLAGGVAEPPISIPEARALNLSADMVFLSCCEGGRLGQDRGTGLDSFTRAFLQAGTESVIASTNRVGDESARQLALRFYDEWRKGRSRAASLLSAQLLIRDNRSEWKHPFFWAYYQLHTSRVLMN